MLRIWWWLPLLIVGALVVTSALLGAWLSGVARDEAAAASGLPLDRVEADGLDITLTGFTDPAVRDAAVATVAALDSSQAVAGVMAAGLEDETDVGGDAESGDADGSTTIGSEIDDSSDRAEGNDSPADDGGGLAPASVVVTFEADGTATMEGAVPDNETRAALLDEVASLLGPDQMVDQLSIDGDAIAVSGGTLMLVGEAGSDEQRQDWTRAASAAATAVGYEITDNLSVMPIETALNALFELEPVEFDERRATLRPVSLPTLDAAAMLINDNPAAGDLRVLGHTDSDGRTSHNLDLSQRRAQAVVDYLVTEGSVDAARLEAVGLGEEQLLISPEMSAIDKQRNRRIEWELVQ